MNYIMNVCAYSVIFDFISLVVLLEKNKEILEIMMKHGIIDALCEVFSTCQDEDTLV